MKGTQECKTLPDELVERIIAMLPFPSIFQARCLSKSWLARFSSIPAQGDEVKRRAAISFQKVVVEKSSQWETYCPVLISTEGDLIAYDKETHDWRTLPSASFLPTKVFTELNIQIDGPLLYASDAPSHKHNGEIYVANILTREWKQLPPPPTTECLMSAAKLVVTDRYSDTYTLILFCKRDLYQYDFFFVQIYNSKSGLWSSKTLAYEGGEQANGGELNAVSLDGVLYMVSDSSLQPASLLAFDIEKGTLDELLVLFSHNGGNIGGGGHYKYVHLVVCHQKLLMVIGGEDRHHNPPKRFQRVFHINGTVGCQMLSDGPSSSVALNSWSTAMPPIGDKNHMYVLYVGQYRSHMRAFETRDEYHWSCSLTPPISHPDRKYKWIASFQPAMGSFIAV